LVGELELRIDMRVLLKFVPGCVDMTAVVDTEVLETEGSVVTTEGSVVLTDG